MKYIALLIGSHARNYISITKVVELVTWGQLISTLLFAIVCLVAVKSAASLVEIIAGCFWYAGKHRYFFIVLCTQLCGEESGTCMCSR